jgi:hypothetical protein
MTTYQRLNKNSATWLTVPGYPDLTPNTNSYKEVSQWIGNKIDELSRYLLGIVTQSLRGGSPAQHAVFNRAIECTWALLAFYLYA